MRTGNLLLILSQDKGVLNQLTLQNSILVLDVSSGLFLGNSPANNDYKKRYRDHQSFYLIRYITTCSTTNIRNNYKILIYQRHHKEANEEQEISIFNTFPV